METPEPADVWASGAAYEPYIGRWSRLVARRFLNWLGVSPGRRWLDVGCGTGALSEAILEIAAPVEVVGVDPSADFVAYARGHVLDPRARFEVGDARGLPSLPRGFDAVVSGLVLNFVPDPGAAVAEMARVARPGGTVGAYVWDYAAGIGLIRRFWDAAVALDPSARDVDEGRRFAAFSRPETLVDLLHGAGLREVESCAIGVPTLFRHFDDYWTPFLGGQGPAPGYAMSLSEDRRVALRERLRADLPVAADGSISLFARAWGVRGVR